MHRLPLVFALVTTSVWTPNALSQCFQLNSTQAAELIPESGAWSLTEEVTGTAESCFFKKSPHDQTSYLPNPGGQENLSNPF